MAKYGLGGVGLEALFGKNTNNKVGEVSTSKLPQGITQDSDGVLWVDIDLLKPNPYQPRKEFTQSSLEELAASIRVQGILQPPTIEDAGDGSFFIIFGERRTRAAKLAGLQKIPVILGHYDDTRKLEAALIENIQRENLNPIDEAKAYRNLMQIANLTQEEVSNRVGKNRATVANTLRLLKLPESMQQSIILGNITSGHARALLSVENEDKRQELFNRIINEKITVRSAESLSQAYNQNNNFNNLDSKNNIDATVNDIKDDSHKTKKAKQKNITLRDGDIVVLEQKLIDFFGTKVNIKGDWTGGSLQIDYFSKSDLERICNLICNNKLD